MIQQLLQPDIETDKTDLFFRSIAVTKEVSLSLTTMSQNTNLNTNFKQ
jgi:hypothetical protein